MNPGPPPRRGAAPFDAGRPVSVEYKVVEITAVTDEAIESVLNEWVAQDWIYDGLQFVVRDSSPRPCMAFVTFKRERADSTGG